MWQDGGGEGKKEETVNVFLPVIPSFIPWCKGNQIEENILSNFSGPEILALQGLVQQQCQNGKMSESRLVEVYEEIFPMGSVKKYVKIVFRVIDQDNCGYIECGQLINFISIMARGNPKQRAELAFKMFDLRREGLLRIEDFQHVRSCHSL